MPTKALKRRDKNATIIVSLQQEVMTNDTPTFPRGRTRVKQSSNPASGRRRSVPPDKEISVPNDFFQHFPIPEKMSLEFLQFCKNTGGFAKEIKCQFDIDVSPKNQPDHKITQVNKLHFPELAHPNNGTLIPFVGDKYDSRCAIVVNGTPSIATIDSGCRSSVVTSSLADKLCPNWRKIAVTDSTQFEGPNGLKLANKGRITLKAILGGRDFKLKMHVIQGNKHSLLLGCPALHALAAVVYPGIGINIGVPNSLHITDTSVLKAKVPVLSTSTPNAGEKVIEEELGEEAMTAMTRPMPPLVLRIFPIVATVVPRYSRCFVDMEPEEKSDWSNHNFQKFLIRPCDCVLKGRECKDCMESSGSPPFQLSQLANGIFKILIANTSPSALTFNRDSVFTADYQSLVIGVKELAQDLLETIEVNSPVCPFTEQEVQDVFNSSVVDFKSQLCQVICEPGGVESYGFRDPILRILPEQPKSFIDASIPIKDYVKANPCDACKPVGLQLCNPARVKDCITANLYRQPLPETGNSNLIKHDVCFDFSKKIKGPFVICKRKGMTDLVNFLEHRLPGYDAQSQAIWRSDGSVAGYQSEFHDLPIIHASTQFLMSVAGKCEQTKQFDIHFPNYHNFHISEKRLGQIFHETNFTLHLYEPNEQLFRLFRMPVHEAGGRRVPVEPRLPPPNPSVQLTPGLPSPIQGGGQKAGNLSDASILCASKEIKAQTEKLLDSFPDLWARTPWDCGVFKDRITGKPVYFELKLKDFKPVIQAPRFLPPARQDAAKQLISGMLNANLIKPMYCRFNQNSVYVKKAIEKISLTEWLSLGYKQEDYHPNIPHPSKKEALRHTLDWSTLNSQLMDLPVTGCDPKQIISSLQNNNLISTIDVASSYWSLLLSRPSQMYTGFSSGLRGEPQYAYQRCVQGCRQSASFLQQAMLNCLMECLSFVFILWDDIIVVSNDEPTMLKRLAAVFQCLQNSGFVVRRHKVALYVGATCSEIELFGLQVDLKLKTVRPIRNKIEALLARPIPANISALRSYLGSINWHHHFIKGAGPHYGVLHKMTHKNSLFVYSEERLVALEYFMDKLTSPECYTHLPRADLEFFIFTDASEFSAGFTLLQCEPVVELERDYSQGTEGVEGVPKEDNTLPPTPAPTDPSHGAPCILPGKPRIISYQSRVFGQQQIRLSIFEKEILATLMAVQCFFDYIEGRRTTLFTDSKNNAYLAAFSKTNSKVARYKIFLESLDFLRIHWVSSGDAGLQIADMLSRQNFKPQNAKNKKVSKQDIECLESITKKLQNGHSYSVAEASYLLDYMFDMDSETREKLPDKSLFMNSEGEVCVCADDRLSNVHLVSEWEREQCFEHTSSTTQEPDQSVAPGALGCEVQVSDDMGVLIAPPCDTCPHPSTAHKLCNVTKQINGKTIADRLKTPGEDFCQQITDILDGQSLSREALIDVYVEPPQTLAPPTPPTFSPDDKTGKFLYCVQENSPHLSFQSLKAEQKKDPYLLKHIEACEKNADKCYMLDDRLKYFLGGTHEVLCREVVDPFSENTRLQICLPAHLAYDFCVVAHRSTRGRAIEMGGLAPHYSVAKMSKILSKRFHIRKLSDILTTISRSCELCHETKPHKRNRPDFVKKILQVIRPGQGWYCDYLKVSTIDNVWGFKELMVFCDCFSNFCVVAPVMRPTTQEYFLQLLHSSVIQYFGKMSFLYTDHASNLSGKLVRDVATILNISHNTVNRFTPRASGAELLNKHLLQFLKIQRESYTLPAEKWCYCLSACVINLNFSPYKDGPGYVSPATKFFGADTLAQNPSFYSDLMSEVSLMYRNPAELLDDTRKAQDMVTELRRLHLAQRYEEAAKRKGTFEADGLLPGDIVVLRHRPRPGASKAWKLERRYKYKFVVVIARGCSVWLRPYSLGSIERWCQSSRIENRSKESNLVLPCFKVDITDVEKVSHGVHLYNSNKRLLHYSEHSMSTPNLNEVEVLSPLGPKIPSCFDPENKHDVYSEYTDFPTGEEVDGMEDDVSYNHNAGDQNQESYFYDDDDVLQRKGPLESSVTRSMIPKPPPICSTDGRVKLVFRKDEEDSAIQDINACTMAPGPESKGCLKVKTLSERLANLAGYSLEIMQTNSISKKSHQVTFNPKVFCHYGIDGSGGCGEEDLQTTSGCVRRRIGPVGRPLTHDNAPLVISNYFDNILLNAVPHSSRDIKYCTCSRCCLPDTMSPCLDSSCELCQAYEPFLWS